jgi:hypothetical protein
MAKAPEPLYILMRALNCCSAASLTASARRKANHERSFASCERIQMDKRFDDMKSSFDNRFDDLAKRPDEVRI